MSSYLKHHRFYSTSIFESINADLGKLKKMWINAYLHRMYLIRFSKEIE